LQKTFLFLIYLHPINDDNYFDIPHNIAWSFKEREGIGILTTGAQFAATGRLVEEDSKISDFASIIAKYILETTFSKIGRLVKELK